MFNKDADVNEILDLQENGILAGNQFYVRQKGEQLVRMVCLDREAGCVVKTLSGDKLLEWGDEIAHDYEVTTREGDFVFGELWDFLQ